LATGNHDYGLSLLLTCCELEPGDLNYRQALRQAQLQVQEKRQKGTLRRLLYSSYYRLRFEMARRLNQHRDVLRFGEDLLTCNPHDVAVQLAMAKAAEEATMPELAIWLLEQARGEAPAHVETLRALARLYEQQGDARHARPLWEQVQRLDPGDREARRHAENLLVRESRLSRAITRPSSRRGLIT
jgi:predicted Zn-dependent protease